MKTLVEKILNLETSIERDSGSGELLVSREQVIECVEAYAPSVDDMVTTLRRAMDGIKLQTSGIKATDVIWASEMRRIAEAVLESL